MIDGIGQGIEVREGPKFDGDRSATLPRVRADTLLAGGRELIIVHQEKEYHLCITKKGRLLLTK